MHEYGIVQNLLSQVDEQVRAHAGKRAVKVELAIDGGHIDERFLRDAFDTFKVETTAREATLVVTETPSEVWCPSCGTQSTSADRHGSCPRCGSPLVQINPHDEIYLKSVEIEVLSDGDR